MEGANALAKQEYCMEFMETLEPPKNCGHGVSTCLPSRCAETVKINGNDRSIKVRDRRWTRFGVCGVCLMGRQHSRCVFWVNRPYPRRISLSLVDSPSAPNR